MRKTEFYVKYGLFDVRANEDSRPSTNNNQTFGNINKLKNNIETKDYATLEEDFFLLDGSKKEMPASITDIAFMSSQMSDSTGDFDNPPQIIINFDEIHTSKGLTFYFMDDYPDKIKVAWYDNGGIVIFQKIFDCNNTEFFLDKQIENYSKLIITFMHTAKPYRYVKLRYLEYGTTIIIGGAGMPVKNAKLDESIDPISSKIATNKLSYKIIDVSDDFNIGNVKGIHKVLQKGQDMLAYEVVDDCEIFLGKFYLKDYNTSNNLTSVNAETIISLLDTINYAEGGILNNVNAGSVLESIFSACQITDYSIDEDTFNTKINGYLPIMQAKKALQLILQVTGSVLDTSRSTGLKIYKYRRNIINNVTRERKFSTSIGVNDYITDVIVEYTNYKKDTELSDIQKGTYNTGTYTIEFKSPVEVTSAVNATIVTNKDNYVVINVTSDNQEVIIRGYKYETTNLSVKSSISGIADSKRKEKKISTTLCNAETAQIVADRILNYYQLTLNLKIKFMNENDELVWSKISNSNPQYLNFVAGFENLNTDLTGGFISNGTLRGYYEIEEEYYRTTELYAGDLIGDAL